MTKLVFVMFSMLTMGATYLTINDIGVLEPSIENAREGSRHNGMRGVGRGHYGK
ncbi:MAG: hypothetical protein OEZ39_15205 [Gammaproteobacteria bacterium]|nr:hypothetical protein [Gammaproteobacteria bacterium]MDH5653202.1 hypothetical protein [Gammaproteobacteria bacterium]